MAVWKKLPITKPLGVGGKKEGTKINRRKKKSALKCNTA